MTKSAKTVYGTYNGQTRGPSIIAPNAQQNISAILLEGFGKVRGSSANVELLKRHSQIRTENVKCPGHSLDPCSYRRELHHTCPW